MKILNELRKAKGFTTFIATTFNVELPWFEALILRQLHQNGVKRFIVFSDAEQLAEALDTQGDNLYRAGRSYLLQKVSSFSTFHPKIYLLASNERARLYVGSGNLSRGGLHRNLEVFERWDIEKNDEAIPQEFSTARDFFYSLLDNTQDYCSPCLKSAIDKTFALHVFTRPPIKGGKSTLFASPGALFNSVPEKTNCEKLTIVSPYFDDHAKFIEDLSAKLGAKTFDVITDTRKTNLLPEAAKRIEALGGRLLNINENKQKRSMHAKAYFASGPTWTWGVIGSANASNAAWRGHNAEMVSIKEGDDASIINDLLNGLITCPFSEDDWAKLEVTAKQKKADEERKKLDQNIHKPAVIQFAEWISLKRIKIIFSLGDWPITIAELHGESTVIQLSSSNESSSELVISLPFTPDRTKGNLVRLGNGLGQLSSWAVIHDAEELIAQAARTGREREKLEELLGKDYFDPDAAQKLLKIYADILKGRTKRKLEEKISLGVQPNVKPKNDPDEEKPNWREIELDEFTGREEKISDYKNKTSSVSIVLSNRLMNQLLFGDIDSATIIIDTEGESELDEDSFNDEDAQKNNAARKIRKTRISQTKQALFLDTAKKTRESYLENLRAQEDDELRNPYRLLEDLQVLVAPLHYMYQGGGMTSFGFRSELVQVMRVILGGHNSPLAISINQLDKENIREFWEHTSAFHLVNLLAYNMCIADLDANIAIKKDTRQGFLKALPSLWLRHLIRTIPSDLLEMLKEKTQNILPSLRCGVFWLGDLLPAWEGRFPYSEFVSEMIVQTHILDSLEEIMDARLAPLTGSFNLNEAEDKEMIIIGRKTKGTLGVGWAEDGKIFIHDGAFQRPLENVHGDTFYEPISRIEPNQAIALEQLEIRLDLLPDDIKKCIDLIKAIDP